MNFFATILSVALVVFIGNNNEAALGSVRTKENVYFFKLPKKVPSFHTSMSTFYWDNSFNYTLYSI